MRPPPTGPPRRQWIVLEAASSAAAFTSSSTSFHMGPWRAAVSPSALARHTPTACVRVSSNTKITLFRKPPFSEKRSWSRATSRHPALKSSHMSFARGGASANGALQTLHVVARAAPPPGRCGGPRGIAGRAPALSRPICRCHRRKHPTWTHLCEPSHLHGATIVSGRGCSSERSRPSGAYVSEKHMRHVALRASARVAVTTASVAGAGEGGCAKMASCCSMCMV